MSAAAVEITRQFIARFNAQDHQGLAETLNYPHVRLAKGHFVQVDSPEAFVTLSQRGEAPLVAEGWHHTDVAALEVVHASPDKAHIALTINRVGADGEIYRTFDTLWIVTCDDEHWEIKFRSSFLR